MPQGIGISRENVEMGISGKQIALGLQTFQVVVLRQNADDVLQALPGGYGSHVADELRDRRLFVTGAPPRFLWAATVARI